MNHQRSASAGQTVIQLDRLYSHSNHYKHKSHAGHSVTFTTSVCLPRDSAHLCYFSIDAVLITYAV